MSENKYVFGSLKDHGEAKRIKNELLKRGIQVEVELTGEGINHLYTLSEEDFPRALDFFRVAIGVKKPIRLEREWKEIQAIPMGNLTYVILILCVIIFGFGWLLKYSQVYEYLLFGPKSGDTFSLIKSGQYWRVLTPAFIHFGFMHVIFNLMWWKDLAKILEHTKGTLFLSLFVLVTAIGSNIFQASFTGSNFGGLSGVVYALLGYLWIYKKFNPKAQFALPKRDIMLMVGWFFLCMIPGIFPFGVANHAHGGGLVLGMIFGLGMAFRDRER